MTGSSGPLAGIVVVELGGIGPAPFCAMLLADLGARVVRVERPGAVAPFGDAHLRYGVVNRSRESLVVDMSRPEGLDAVLRVVAAADVVIEGFRPGVAERLGVGPAACHALAPHLVYGRITGWGHGGPWSERAGHELNYVAIAGGLAPVSRAGEPGAPPAGQNGHIGAAATSLALGVVSAMLEARNSGEGQIVEASVVDSVVTRMALTIAVDAARDEPGSAGANAPCADTYRCADDRYVVIAAVEDIFYTRLLETLGLTEDPALAGDRFDTSLWPRMRPVLAAAFVTRTRDQWVEIFEGVDACLSPVLTVSESIRHPHNLSRGVHIDVGGLTQPAPAPHFSRTVLSTPRPAAQPGTDSESVLRSVGMPDEEIAELLATGVITTSPRQS